MPSGKTARPNITDNKDGTITVRYAPTEKGLHQMGIKYDGNHIPGELWAGPGRAVRATSFLPASLPQTSTGHLLCAGILRGPGEAGSLVEGSLVPVMALWQRCRAQQGGCWVVLGTEVGPGSPRPH